MKELIERFYNSIRSGGLPPIPYREILLTARIMDETLCPKFTAERRKSEDQTISDSRERKKSSSMLEMGTESASHRHAKAHLTSDS